LTTTNGHIYSSLMSISKQTEFFLQQMSNGDVLMSVMSISEKNRSPFCSKWSCFDEYDVYFKKAKSFLEQMILFIQVWCLFRNKRSLCLHLWGSIVLWLKAENNINQLVQQLIAIFKHVPIMRLYLSYWKKSLNL
jgi:hypothetical protein